MIGTLEQVVVLKRLDLLGFLKGDGSVADLVILRYEHGDRETLDVVELVEGTLSVTRIFPVLNVLLEAFGLFGLLPVVLVLQRGVTLLIKLRLPLSPIANIFVELRTNFGLVIAPSGCVRGVNSNTAQLVLDVASPLDFVLKHIVLVCTCVAEAGGEQYDTLKVLLHLTLKLGQADQSLNRALRVAKVPSFAEVAGGILGHGFGVGDDIIGKLVPSEIPVLRGVVSRAVHLGVTLAVLSAAIVAEVDIVAEICKLDRRGSAWVPPIIATHLEIVRAVLPTAMLEENGALCTDFIASLFVPDVEEGKLVIVTSSDSKGLPVMVGIRGGHQIGESCVAHYFTLQK